MVSSVCRVSSANSGVVMKPNWQAAWRALSSMPTLVGDTRAASNRPVFLNVVGDQVVVVLPAEFAKNARCAAHLTQEGIVLGG